VCLGGGYDVGLYDGVRSDEVRLFTSSIRQTRTSCVVCDETVVDAARYLTHAAVALYPFHTFNGDATQFNKSKQSCLVSNSNYDVIVQF